MSLVDTVAAALKDKTMGVAEAADAIRKAGYKSNAASFRIYGQRGAVQAAVQAGGEGPIHCRVNAKDYSWHREFSCTPNTRHSRGGAAGFGPG